MIENKIEIIPGFSWFGKNIGIKDNTLDFGGILADTVCNAAGVFTKNTMAGPPVIVGKEHLRDGKLQAVIVNSKNANVATSTQGIKDAKIICSLVAESCGIQTEMVLPSSTGVIGKRLPMDVITNGCKSLKQDFGKTEQHIIDFAHSIMTTDTRTKWVTGKAGNAKILGIAKGSGMIEPNMATMLCYFMSDAKIESDKLHQILTNAVNKSFNRISVDTDTSTSDTVIIMCNGLAGPVDLNEFESTLTEMSIFLAKEIASDGEGATKLIELVVSGAQTQEQALLTAKSVINSPLIKTAIYGSDPNWGRFVMAIGKVFQYSVNISDLKIYFGKGADRIRLDAEVLDRNEVPLDKISAILGNNEVHIEIVIGKGLYSEKVWGCDLTEGYVNINAHYTT
ncbi:MAG: bifunctional glutamate N-acetyltransferase/amino-acid acetyltransferase ArgJ [Deltaproteobacteria bacterium]|nr:bifunctional glutamate N-acetyltransferase/amino-acid acetyltransferase ArgJ [Deltaproteobacteria bacterium]